MGFDALFFSRHDYDDHKIRISKNTLELLWQPSPSLGRDADLFTGILYNGYRQPDGLCFDTVCKDEFIQVARLRFEVNIQLLVYCLLFLWFIFQFLYLCICIIFYLFILFSFKIE